MPIGQRNEVEYFRADAFGIFQLVSLHEAITVHGVVSKTKVKHRIKAIVAEALIGQQIAQPISSARCSITLSQFGYYYLFS